MQIVCPACGEALEVQSDIAEGQHILCPYCNSKFAFNPTRSQSVRTILSMCPYCSGKSTKREHDLGVAEPCPHCGKNYIVANGKGLPVVSEQTSGHPVLSFFLGFLFSILGVICVCFIDKKNIVKAVCGALIALALQLLAVGCCVSMSRQVSERSAAAASMLSEEEGDRARSAYEALSEDTLRELRAD